MLYVNSQLELQSQDDEQFSDEDEELSDILKKCGGREN